MAVPPPSAAAGRPTPTHWPPRGAVPSPGGGMKAKLCLRPAAAPSAASRGLPGRSRRPGDFGEVPDVAGAIPTGSVTAGRAAVVPRPLHGGAPSPGRRGGHAAAAARSSIPEARAASVEDRRARGVQRPRRGAAPAPGHAVEATPRPQQAYGPSRVIGHGGGAPRAALDPRPTLTAPPGASSRRPGGGADPPPTFFCCYANSAIQPHPGKRRASSSGRTAAWAPPAVATAPPPPGGTRAG